MFALDVRAVCVSAGQSELAALVASVLLENRNLEGMVGRRGIRRESPARDRSLISGSVECSGSRGESGWFSMSSARPLAAAAGSTRRRITRLNILVVEVRGAVGSPSSQGQSMKDPRRWIMVTRSYSYSVKSVMCLFR